MSDMKITFHTGKKQEITRREPLRFDVSLLVFDG